MEERPFSRKALPPTDDLISKELAAVAPSYRQLMDVTSAFSTEWIFSKNSGWIQKVYDKKKALLYLVPLSDEFTLSMTVREREREILLRDSEISSLREQLAQAKKYSEGYAMQFRITNKKSFSECVRFVKKIIALRSGKDR
jgi:hypothetical protein